ncbi:MAG: menaquinone-dependent protoporphyrinogen IX dehydrogenase [Propionivibrio sp.]
MAHILILYSTVDGHTAKICQRLEQVIEKNPHEVVVAPIGDSSSFELARFDKIVIGASIRYGKHRKEVLDFIAGNLSLLASKPSAFFSVNIVARKPEKNTPETNPYMRKFLSRVFWQPKLLAVFAGRLDYPSYGPVDRFMIRLIMRMTNGPTDPTTVVEFTDWNKVDDFARQISKLK